MPRPIVLLALFAILVLGGALRLQGQNWDAGQHLHPDERFLAIVGDKIRFPDRPLEYFDTRRSPLNPYNQGFDGFAYGTAPLFLARALGEAFGMASYDRIHLLGRGLSAGFDLGTVLLTFLLGRLVYGTVVGLLAAALLAVTVLHIQLAHFFAVDTFLAFATTLALYAAYRAWLGGRRFDYALLGLGLGLAAATKLSAALLLPIVVLVAVVPPPGGHRARSLTARLVSLAVCGLVALLVYRVGEPYSFQGDSWFGLAPNVQRFADLDRWVKISSGEVEVPYMVQWAGTPNPWFALRGIVEWGFGPAAGLSAIAGLVIAAVELRRWPRHGHHLLLVAWAGINLIYFGFQFAKFLRYLLPVYPALAVLAASLLVRISGPAVRSLHPLLRPFARLVAPAVLAAAALYAFMFSSVYQRPHTRVEASDWIYRNVPAGSTLAVEHWDDALPLRLPGRETRYTEVSMTLYDDESPDKARKLAENLRRADYVILSSNRLLDSIPRLPRRFPIATEYYRLLLGGQLGFDLVARFESRPRLFGLAVDDAAAPEDFTVYDHPTVLIFRKSPTFSAQRVGELLGRVPLGDLERTKPVEAGAWRGLLLEPLEWQRVRASGTWSERFSLDGLAARFAVPLWLLVVELLGLLALPLCWWLFPGLPDRGFAVAKVVGLVLVSYLAWLAASLQVAPFGQGLVLACLAAWGAAALVLLVRCGRAMIADLAARKALLAATELVFLGAFAIMLAIRLANPDLWHSTFGGEKPMDFAYLNAVLKTPSFPPYDPWFAGGYINYYYYGFVLVATLTHLSAVPPAQAYNLAIATIFALTAGAAFGFGVAVTAGARGARRRFAFGRAVAAGVATAVALCLLGNLDGAVQVRDGLWKLGGEGLPSALPALTGLTRAAVGLLAVLRGADLPPFDFWRSTRFIGPEEPGPIHEFPFFTFLYGDLHAHMVALPLQVSAVVVALQLVRSGPPSFLGTKTALPATRWRRRPRVADVRLLGLLLLAALLAGTLRATNTWDFPTYLLVAAGAAVLALRPGRRIGWLGAGLAGIGLGLGLYAASSLLFLPYLRRYELFYSGVAPSEAATPLGQFLAIHGLLLFAILGWLAYRVARSWPSAFGNRGLASRPTAYYGVALPAIRPEVDLRTATVGGLLLAIVLLFALNGRGVVGLLLALLAVGSLLARSGRRSPETLFMLGLAAVAAGALLLPELAAVRGDVGRMNTVFKFYLQAWVLLSLLAGPAAVWTIHRVRRGRMGSGGGVWALGLGLLVACAAIYPLRGTPAKLELRLASTEPTLDGMAYMAQAQHFENRRDLALPADYRAIRWVLENVPGTPVILEGQAPLYHWGSRFSVYTGLPTVLGWDWHQKQQRWAYQDRVEERQRDVRTAYQTTDLATARSIFRKYDIGYVVVGGLERAYYPAAGLEKFERMLEDGLEVVYRAEGVTIYRVVAV